MIWKYLLIGITWLGLSASAAFGQTMVEAEYFVDTDPGVGNAQRVSWEENVNVEGQANFEVSVGNLPTGTHRLGVRTRNADGTWSLTRASTFFVQGAISPVEPTSTPIVAMEYFWQEDPGFGAGIPIAIPSPALEIELDQALALPEGFTSGRLLGGIRVQDQTGKWGLTQPLMAFVQPPLTSLHPAPSPIAKVEYFISIAETGENPPTELELGQAPSTALELGGILSNDVVQGLGVGRYLFTSRVTNEADQRSLNFSESFDICPEEVTGGFEVTVEGYNAIISSTSVGAFEWDYDMGNPNDYSEQEFTEADFQYRYELGGTYEICQTASNECEQVVTCQTIIIDGPRLQDGIELEPITFVEDAPGRIVYEDLNALFISPAGEPMTFAFNGFSFAQGEVGADNSLFIQPTPNFSGEAEVQIRIETPTTEAFVFIPFIVSGLPDPPIFFNPLPDVEMLEDEFDSLFLTNDMSRHLKDFENDRVSLYVTTDTAAVTPRLLPTIKTDSTGFAILIEPNYFGTAQIIFEANDSLSHPNDFQTSYDTLLVVVNQIADRPRLKTVIPNANLDEGFLETRWVEDLNNHFIDDDGDLLAFSATSENPSIGVAIEGNQLFLTADEEFSGTGSIAVTATEQTSLGLSLTSSFQTTVNAVNDPPIWVLPAEQVFCAKEPFLFDFSELLADDISGLDRLAYSGKIVSVEPSSVAASSLQIGFPDFKTAQFTSVSRDHATYRVELSATDPGGLIGKDTLSVKVLGASISLSNGTYTANTGDSYQWYANGVAVTGAAGRTYRDETNATDIQVEVTQGSCTVLSQPYSGTVTAINDPFVDQLVLYPNPVQNRFRLLFEGAYRGGFSLQLLDLQGKQAFKADYSKRTHSFAEEIPMDHLPKGVYVMRLSLPQSTYHLKLMKK